METERNNWFSCLMDYAKDSKGKLWGSVVLSIISILSGLIPYYCVYKMIALYTDNEMTKMSILYWGLIIFLAYLVKVAAFGLSTGISHQAAYQILEQLRLRVADAFMHAPLGEVSSHSIGEIKNMMVDKIGAIEPPLAHLIPEGTGHALLPLASLVGLFWLDYRVALASLVTLPLAFVCMVLTYQISGKNFDTYNKANSYMNSTIVEYIEGIEIIKAFGREGTSYEKYARAITDYKEFILKWLSSTWITMKLAFALFPSTLLGTLPVALLLYSQGRFSPAQVALCCMLSMSMIGSLSKLEVFSEGIREMQFTIEQLQQYLNMPSLPEAKDKGKLKGYDIKFHNVTFSYDGKKEHEVLHGININMKQGSFTALVGPSGGGKSTIAKLLARFWDVTGGSIEIGGVNIKDIPLKQLADIVSFVTQDNFLFRCSLLENIRLGNPKATDEEVYAAAKAAKCHEFIEKLDNGYHTLAGEAGKRLSGGEKQRIAIARMLLKNAPIVILDEATAFTDPENEAMIQSSIAALTKGKTLLVIAHRLSTIKNADKIIVIKDGAVNSIGTQEELLVNSPLYATMWKAHIGAKAWSVGLQGKEVVIDVSNH